MPDRKTIRPTADVYHQLNDDRTDRGMTWDAYLTTLLEGTEPDQAQPTDADTQEITDQLEKLTQLVDQQPTRVADRVEERLHR